MNRYRYPNFKRPTYDPYAWIYKYDNVFIDEVADGDEYDLELVEITFPKVRKKYIELSSLWINADFIKRLNIVPEAHRNAVIREQQRIDTQPLHDELMDPEARKKYE